MTRLILGIYSWFRTHRFVCLGIFVCVTALLLGLISRLSYKEDISDFLPMDADSRAAMSVYRDVSGANRIYALVSMKDSAQLSADRLSAGVDMFTEALALRDTAGLLPDVTARVDLENIMEVQDRIYDDLPLFLTESDYARADSLLSIPGYAAERMRRNREALQFPASGFSADAMRRDPLDLFSPVTRRLSSGNGDMAFESYDGYILTPDGSRAIVMMESAFGSSESDNNGRIMAMLDSVRADVAEVDPAFDIHVTGGPAIAVDNADRIKKDSILAVAVAGALILALLIYVFRNVVNILLIFVSVGWGWLFALGCIALYYDSISVIVLGISSVMLGVAINYPLHLIDHLKETSDTRLALREIVSPLVVGNVTTVGAFLCLVPLNATALHDLGLFSSLLLVGTILFVLLFLPQVVRRDTKPRSAGSGKSWLSSLADAHPERSKPVMWGLAVLTCLFAYFSLDTGFDSDMRNINYMTPQNRADMDYFQSLMPGDKDTEPLYVVGSGDTWDEALMANERAERVLDSLSRTGELSRRGCVTDFLPSRGVRQKRLSRWERFRNEHAGELRRDLSAACEAEGFNPDAFSPFFDMLDRTYAPKKFEELHDIFALVFAGNLSSDAATGRKSVVQIADVPVKNMDKVKDEVSRNFGGLCFDVAGMNASIANTLSDDFNYICFACGCIVFIFLWLSFGSIELALISFLPMALSWLWILGIMALCDIRFNIVNIILATFIFGQGDDYTIFITEGMSYEYAYRRKVLASYKNSIMVSALIMFIGIGTLVFAQHPAMRSLGQVTVVGMFTVVLMAYVIPPFFFNWITHSHGKVRLHPLTLASICMSLFRPASYRARNMRLRECKATDADLIYAVSGRFLYKGRDIERSAKKNLRGIRAHFDNFRNLPEDGSVLVDDRVGQGETALALALLHPECAVTCRMSDADKADLLRGCAADFVSNLSVTTDGNTVPENCTSIIIDRHGDIAGINIDLLK